MRTPELELVEETDTTIEVSVVLPCLNEVASVGLCVVEALTTMKDAGIEGEVIVVDNGSTDGSREAAAGSGARIVDVAEQGYGNALRGGISAARGMMVVIADADFTYDLRRIPELLAPIRSGAADLVVGGRLSEASGSTMPLLHRYLGTPTLRFLVRRSTPGLAVTDTQSGFRAFHRSKLLGLGLRSSGMEFASEMLVRAAQHRLRIVEVETGYRRRLGQSKLATFADGRRHLRLILLLAPHLLLTWPGATLLVFGTVMSLASVLSPAGFQVGSLSWQPVFFSTITTVLGLQAWLAGVVIAYHSPLVPSDVARHYQFVGRPAFAKCALGVGAVLTSGGLLIDVGLFIVWARHAEIARSVELAGLAQTALLVGPVLVAFGLIYPMVKRSSLWLVPSEPAEDVTPIGRYVEAARRQGLSGLVAASDILDTSAAGPAAIRGGIVRVAAHGAGLALSVAGATLLFRHLGVTDGGRYVLVISVATIAVGFADAGLLALGLREIARRDVTERAKVLSDLLGIRLVLSTLAIVASCAYVAAAGHGGSLVLGTFLVGVALLLQGVASIATLSLQAQLRFSALAAADLIRQVVTTMAIACLVLRGVGLTVFFLVPLAGAVAGSGAGLWFVRSDVPRRPTFDRDRWRVLMRFGLPFALASAIGILYFRVGVVVLDRFGDTEQTGLYGISFRITEAFVNLPVLAVGAVFPIFTRAGRDDRARLQAGVQRTFDVSLALGALLSGLLITAAPILLGVIGGARYDEAVPVLRWHALALWGTCAAATSSYALLALGRLREVLWMSCTAFVVSVATITPLAAAHGAVGAAAGSALAELALAGSGAVLLRRCGRLAITYRTGWSAAMVTAAGAAPALIWDDPRIAVPIGGLLLVVGLAAARLIPFNLVRVLRAH